MKTYEANGVAIKGFAQAIRLELRKLGMRRCSVRLVYNQGEEPRTRLDWYGLFWRWFLALWRANQKGAEFLFEDFRARVQALRERDQLSSCDWYTEVARCESEHSEALQAAILNRDDAAIRKELAEDIAAKRKLLALVEARRGSGPLGHTDRPNCTHPSGDSACLSTQRARVA